MTSKIAMPGFLVVRTWYWLYVKNYVFMFLQREKTEGAGGSFEAGDVHQGKAVNADGKICVPIPEHGGKDIKIGTPRAILDQL